MAAAAATSSSSSSSSLPQNRITPEIQLLLKKEMVQSLHIHIKTMKPPSAHQTLNPPKHIPKRSSKTQLGPNFLWICLLKRESITYYSTIATYRNPCGGITNHRLGNSYSYHKP
jgi:hypothetical protein